jgi:hypothetical protein
MKTRKQEALDEKRHELRQWKHWRRERLDALLTGPYAEPAQALLAFLKTMTSPTALIDFIKAGPWRDADESVRFEILSLVDAVIIKRRERMNLAPFDDALPGQPDNVFLVLRALLTPRFPSADGATRGVARFHSSTQIQNHERT